MTLPVLIQTYPDLCLALAMSGFFLASVLSLFDSLHFSALERAVAARCEKFHGQQITGWCSGSGCPHRKQCYYHSGYQRPTFCQFLKRNKP